ncbi:MAG TPA: GNAT family N-acetyltransferase [Acidimicrobiales bacterium]|nr:GNAT family N-acetyltransferase [Acidimicrobiales bacterium]
MDRAELLAYGDANLAATLRHYARTTPGAHLEDDGRLLLVSTSTAWPGPYHNGAFRLDHAVDPSEVLLRAEGFFSGRCPAFCLWVAGHADGDLEQAARERGYASISEAGVPRMALDRPLAPGADEASDGIALAEVVDDAGRRDYLAVTIEAYAGSFLPADAAAAQLASLDAVHAPGVRAVVAYDGAQPLAAAMTVMSERVAGIQLVGTVPAARRRGLGERCTRWAVAAAFELGAEAVVLEASEDGDPLYRRMGFTEVSRYRFCLGPPRIMAAQPS